MKLSVYVLGREVAVLESAGDFKSVLTYLQNTAVEHFVSLTMPVRTESWVWDDQLPESCRDPDSRNLTLRCIKILQSFTNGKSRLGWKLITCSIIRISEYQAIRKVRFP